MSKSLFAVFAEDRYPHQAAVALGPGVKLKLSYRASAPAHADAVREFLENEVKALGLQLPTLLRGIVGKPKNDKEKEAVEEAFAALGDEAGEKVTAAFEKAEGYALSLVVGAWSLLEGEEEFSLTEAVTPDTCAALPADVKKAITRLSAAAEAPSDALDFFGKPPRSSQA